MSRRPTPRPTECARRSRFAVLRRFRRDRRGVTAIEFAVVSVPFLGLLMAIFQAGLYFFSSEALEAAVQDAARSVYTGEAQGASITNASDFVNNYLCPANGGTKLSILLDCTKLIVDIRPAPTSGSFSGIDTNADFYQTGTATKFCLGAPNDIVIVRVIYPLPVFAPILVTTTGRDVQENTAGSVVFNNAGRKQILLGTAVFQNEPFANGYVAPSGC